MKLIGKAWILDSIVRFEVAIFEGLERLEVLCGSEYVRVEEEGMARVSVGFIPYQELLILKLLFAKKGKRNEENMEGEGGKRGRGKK